MGLLDHPFDGGGASRTVFVDDLLVSIDGATIVLSLLFRRTLSMMFSRSGQIETGLSKGVYKYDS